MNKINWVIIGCGDVCEKKSGPAFYKIEYSALIAVMRRAGTKGKIIFNTFSSNPIQLITDANVENFEFISPEHIQQPLIQSVVNELRGVGICPSNANSGARTSRIMDLILKDK